MSILKNMNKDVLYSLKKTATSANAALVAVFCFDTKKEERNFMCDFTVKLNEFTAIYTILLEIKK